MTPSPKHLTTKEVVDTVYSVGFKNGQIEMKNKVLKKLNRDWTLIHDSAVVVKVLKKVNAIRLTKPKR